MEMETKKINRSVHFPYVQAFDDEDSSGKNNTWIWDRAPDGYKFILHSVQVCTAYGPGLYKGIVALFDGHEYTHWNIWPGVQSAEMLARLEHISPTVNTEASLNGWECKEYTIGIRSTSGSAGFKASVIVWFYLEKMTPDETKMYAVLQPRSEHYRKGGPTTLTEGEETED